MIDSTFRASRITQREVVLNFCFICEKSRPGPRGFLLREYTYVRINFPLGSTSQHASSREPCGVTLSADLCEIRTAELPENFVTRAIPPSRMRKVTRVFVLAQSFDPCNSIVYTSVHFAPTPRFTGRYLPQPCTDAKVPVEEPPWQGRDLL